MFQKDNPLYVVPVKYDSLVIAMVKCGCLVVVTVVSLNNQGVPNFPHMVLQKKMLSNHSIDNYS